MKVIIVAIGWKSFWYEVKTWSFLLGAFFLNFYFFRNNDWLSAFIFISAVCIIFRYSRPYVFHFQNIQQAIMFLQTREKINAEKQSPQG